MYLFQILLPLFTKNNRQISRAEFSRVNDELTKRYGGVTSYMRAPAEGLWITSGNKKARDQIVTIEVMTSTRAKRWWRKYQKTLERRFDQQYVVIRYQVCKTI